MRIWRKNRRDLEAAFAAAMPLDRQLTKQLANEVHLSGCCTACQNIVDFNVTNQPLQEPWRNLNEGMICPICGTNGRTRNIIEVWREVRHQIVPADTLILERITPLFGLMRAEDSSIRGCEFISPEFTSGNAYQIGSLDVVHENFQQLSCSDNSIDLLMHFDVLEHVPNYRAAFKEAHRVIRPGGKMLFTVPFYPDLDENIVCATQDEAGNIIHLRPPAYHGNPMSPGGSLVFTIPGWEILRDLTVFGFKTDVSFTFDPLAGIISNGCPFPDGLAWPLVFCATKPETPSDIMP